MRLLFAVIGLLGFSLSATAASEWLYYKEYPWVYDAKSQDWLYLRGAADGSIYAYRNSTKEWEEFTASEPILRTSSGQVVVGKFDNQYKYRDLAGITTWTVYETGTGWRIQTGYHDGEGNSYSATGAFDQLPSSGFSQSEYEISDEGVYIWNPNRYALYYEIESVVDGVVTSNYGPYGAASLSKSYFFISKDKAEEFYNLKISESNIPVPTWDDQYEEWILNPEPYGGLSVLQQIKEAKDSGATELNLEYSNISDLWPLVGFDTLTSLNLKGNIISDLTPLQGLTNLISLVLWENNINDLSPLSGLKNLESLDLDDNNISDLSALTGLSNLEQLYLFGNPVLASQKAMLEEALPNTNINWPDWLIEDGFGLTETEFNSYVVGKYFNVSDTYNGEYDEASSLMFNSNGTITYYDKFGEVEVDDYEVYWEYDYNNGNAKIIISDNHPSDGSSTWTYFLSFNNFYEGTWQSLDTPDEYGTFTVTEGHPNSYPPRR